MNSFSNTLLKAKQDKENLVDPYMAEFIQVYWYYAMYDYLYTK